TSGSKSFVGGGWTTLSSATTSSALPPTVFVLSRKGASASASASGSGSALATPNAISLLASSSVVSNESPGLYSVVPSKMYPSATSFPNCATPLLEHRCLEHAVRHRERRNRRASRLRPQHRRLILPVDLGVNASNFRRIHVRLHQRLFRRPRKRVSQLAFGHHDERVLRQEATRFVLPVFVLHAVANVVRANHRQVHRLQHLVELRQSDSTAPASVAVDQSADFRVVEQVRHRLVARPCGPDRNARVVHDPVTPPLHIRNRVRRIVLVPLRVTSEYLLVFRWNAVVNRHENAVFSENDLARYNGFPPHGLDAHKHSVDHVVQVVVERVDDEVVVSHTLTPQRNQRPPRQRDLALDGRDFARHPRNTLSACDFRLGTERLHGSRYGQDVDILEVFERQFVRGCGREQLCPYVRRRAFGQVRFAQPLPLTCVFNGVSPREFPKDLLVLVRSLPKNYRQLTRM